MDILRLTRIAAVVACVALRLNGAEIAEMEPGYMNPSPGEFKAYREFLKEVPAGRNSCKYRFAIVHSKRPTEAALYVVCEFSYVDDKLERSALRCVVSSQLYLESRRVAEGTKTLSGEEAVTVMNAIDASEIFASTRPPRDRWLSVAEPYLLAQERTPTEIHDSIRTIESSWSAQAFAEYLRRLTR